MEEFGLVQFMPLAIEDKDSVQAVIAAVDKATGFVFKGLAKHDPYPEIAYTATAQPMHMPSYLERAETAASSRDPPQVEVGAVAEHLRKPATK